MGLLSAIRRSPFLDGVARLMDFEGILVEQDRYEGFEADARNLRGDWEQIGAYMGASDELDRPRRGKAIAGVG